MDMHARFLLLALAVVTVSVLRCYYELKKEL